MSNPFPEDFATSAVLLAKELAEEKRHADRLAEALKNVMSLTHSRLTLNTSYTDARAILAEHRKRRTP